MNVYESGRRLACLLVLLAPAAAAQEFFGPVPYLSAADTPDGFPTQGMVIEDFEDGLIDARLIPSTTQVIVPGGITDSVDADDGVIDGDGRGGHTLFGGSVRIGFRPPLPTAAGMVWTDGAQSGVSFEAFDADGLSLGVIGPFVLGDGSISGTTAEDRFFGIVHADGIAAIQLLSGAVMEIDHVHYNAATEPAIMSTIEDGNLGVLLPTPDGNLPNPLQVAYDLPAEARPHGLAFLGGKRVLFADFAQPRLLQARRDEPDLVASIALPGRSTGNGSLAVDPNGRHALSIGESNATPRTGEAVVVDFGAQPPQVMPITGGLRVLSFVTAAIDFAPDGRAFVCHTDGVSVLDPPYTAVAFTMPFPPVQQSPSMCRLSRDGSRLFVTRVLSETVPTPIGVHTTGAPYSADSRFVTMPAPAGVQGLGPLAVSPDGTALLVGQQFLFPPSFSGTRARLFLLRAPFDGSTAYDEIALPAAVSGMNCSDDGSPVDCSGFEHIEVSEDGRLAIVTGNSGSAVTGAADAVRAVFVRNPFVDAERSVVAVTIAAGATPTGRGAGGIRFQPARVFADSLELP